MPPLDKERGCDIERAVSPGHAALSLASMILRLDSFFAMWNRPFQDAIMPIIEGLFVENLGVYDVTTRR